MVRTAGIEGGDGILRRVLTSLFFGLFLAGSVRADVMSTCRVDAPLPQVQSIPGWDTAGAWQMQPIPDSLGSVVSAHSLRQQHDFPVSECALASKTIAPGSRKPGSSDDIRVRVWLTNQAILREDPGVPVFQGDCARSIAETIPNGRSRKSLLLTGGSGSCALCMYALMGLGLYNASGLIKRAFCCQVTELCHGSFQGAQAGDCGVFPRAPFATGPGSGLVPPHEPPCRAVSPYSIGIAVSLCRTSQFTLNLLVARGPPMAY